MLVDPPPSRAALRLLEINWNTVQCVRFGNSIRCAIKPRVSAGQHRTGSQSTPWPVCETRRRMEKFLQIAPHSLAIVLSRVGTEDEAAAAVTEKLQHHHTGYEIFADFKAENMQHFWNKKVTDAISETFFLGWIDEHVLLIQGKEDHLEVLREGWTRRGLKPPRGFEIKCIGKPDQMVSHSGTLAAQPGEGSRQVLCVCDKLWANLVPVLCCKVFQHISMFEKCPIFISKLNMP